jgi:hypothetical protein
MSLIVICVPIHLAPRLVALALRRNGIACVREQPTVVMTASRGKSLGGANLSTYLRTSSDADNGAPDGGRPEGHQRRSILRPRGYGGQVIESGVKLLVGAILAGHGHIDAGSSDKPLHSSADSMSFSLFWTIGGS